MDEKTILAELKKYIAGDWGKQNPKFAERFSKLEEKDIEIGEAPDIIFKWYDYNATGVGERDSDEQKFPLTRNFKSNEMYFTHGEKRAVSKELNAYVASKKKLNLFGQDVYFCVFDINDIEGALMHDARKKFKEEFRMYGASHYAWHQIRINDYTESTEHHLDTRTCQYIPFYANVQDAEEQKTILLGYITNDSKEEIIFEIEKDGLKISEGAANVGKGCLIIGLGLICPPVLIGYFIYLLWKKGQNSK